MGNLDSAQHPQQKTPTMQGGTRVREMFEGDFEDTYNFRLLQWGTNDHVERSQTRGARTLISVTNILV